MTDLTKDDILAVGYARLSHIEKDFPKLDRANYASDAEYLQALQQQYLALRQQEYEYVCMSQAYDTYLASRCVDDKTCRSIMYSVEDGVVFNKMSELCVDEEEPNRLEDIEEKYRIYTHASDSVVFNNAAKNVHAVHHVYETPGNGKQKRKTSSASAHCAMTALCIITGISSQLGYENEASFTHGASNAANAALIHGWDSSISGKKTDRAICKGNYSVTPPADKRKSVRSLILSGELGPGDIISTGADQLGSAHGYHALTIASVNRNEQGEIVSYTVMDNNGGTSPKTRLLVHDINDTHDSLNYKKVIYTKTHEWANDNFNKEIAGKSAEELEAMIAGTKDRISNNVLIDLSRSECSLLMDESYIETCGKTLKGYDRAPGLKLQQDAFRTFYAGHNQTLMNEGLAIMNESKMFAEQNVVSEEIPHNIDANIPVGKDVVSEDVILNNNTNEQAEPSVALEDMPLNNNAKETAEQSADPFKKMKDIVMELAVIQVNAAQSFIREQMQQDSENAMSMLEYMTQQPLVSERTVETNTQQIAQQKAQEIARQFDPSVILQHYNNGR